MSILRLSFSITLAVAALLANDLQAQESTLGRSVRRSEQAARANWQPTRTKIRQTQIAVPQNERRATTRTIEQVQVEGLPSPPPESAFSIISPSQPEPLDGQITLAPIYEGEIACDQLPGGCGCDDPGCVGCDTIGCDGGCGASCCGEFCGGNAWRPCLTLCMPQDGWASFEFLGWWQDGMQLPPLVTTSVGSGVPQLEAGVLGLPATRILAGGDAYHEDALDGGRFRFGLWLDSCHNWGVGAEYFNLSSTSDLFVASSPGSPILARPFYNVTEGEAASSLIAFANLTSGTVTVESDSKLRGGGFRFRNLRRADEGCTNWFLCGCPEHFCSRTEIAFGYRYLQLDEGVRVTENSIAGGSLAVERTGTFDIYDSFRTRNQFNGFDLGYITRRTRGFWSLETGIRLAVGITHQTVNIAGQSTIGDTTGGVPPTPTTYPGGMLALSSNIGSYTQDEFAVVPELDLKIGYQMTEQFMLTLGYTGIYWSNVVRPGDQIDLDVNPDLLPPTVISGSHPTFAFDTTDYWVQGLNFGCEYRW